MVAEAKAELQQALDLDPNLLWARFYLAKVYIDLGLNEKAKDQLERGLKTRPDVRTFCFHTNLLTGSSHVLPELCTSLASDHARCA
jgi:tetratricopeptide (TPR) repeat protein